MTLQEIFIINLKKYRKMRGVSQMTLAELCDTSGNYIGQIEMGRRIPSFEKIEKIANALQIDTYRLFIQDIDKTEEQELKTSDFPGKLPYSVKNEITTRLLSSIHRCIDESLKAKNYF
jgi:transcriptional regulator with XRE-family HTH domain